MSKEAASGPSPGPERLPPPPQAMGRPMDGDG
jgi:hypothetical protein